MRESDSLCVIARVPTHTADSSSSEAAAAAAARAERSPRIQSAEEGGNESSYSAKWTVPVLWTVTVSRGDLGRPCTPLRSLAVCVCLLIGGIQPGRYLRG